MDNSQWFHFFISAAEILGPGDCRTEHSQSWCAWTTFERLKEDAGYWTCGLPSPSHIFATYIGDGGVWGQPFHYPQLAHIILPSEFTWETIPGPDWESGIKKQNIKALSMRLHELNVPHRLTDLVLEVKCY